MFLCCNLYLMSMFLGVLKVGVIYLFLDLFYFVDCIVYMLEDFGIKLVVVFSEYEFILIVSLVYYLDKFDVVFDFLSFECLVLQGDVKFLFYVIYIFGLIG